MRTNYLLLASAALLLLGACAKEPQGPETPAAKGRYTLSASASDAMTKAFFKEDEAPSKFIYWEADDVFDFHNLTLSEGALAEKNVTTSVPSSLSDDAKTAVFSVDGEDFVVLTYPKDAVTLTGLDAAGVQATVNVPKEQPLSSVLTPEVVPMASYPIALSDAAKAAVADASVSGESLGEDPVKLFPLAGIVKMTVKGLPGVTTAKVNKIQVGVGISSPSAGKPQVGVIGDNVFELKNEINYMSVYAAADNYQRHEIVLSADTPLDYSAENGLTACFAVNHSSEPLNLLYVTVSTEDGKSIYKKFNLSANKIATEKSKISSFTLDFTSGAITQSDENLFAVEWAPGFLKEDGGKYVFGDKSDIGLYFRFGSAEGLKLFDNAGFKDAYDKGGVQRLYSDFAMQLQDQWTPVTLYYPEGGAIKSKSMAQPTDVYSLAWSEKFEGATDPCSYVEVTDGGNKWRVPTKDEVQDLIDKGKVGISFGTLDGTPMAAGNKTPGYVQLTDGEQEVFVRVTTFLQFSLGVYQSAAYHQLNLYNGWTGAYFWTNTLHTSYTSAGATGATQSAYAFNKGSLEGAVNPFDNYPSIVNSNMDVNRTVNGITDYTKGAFLNVRCVRDKGAAQTKANALGTEFGVNDYGVIE
ncbi:MAG: hypothetical protein IJ623_00290 [Bacteroidales bacterium]|nr:hypothetical protein [Bacteroidales bacterium]